MALSPNAVDLAQREEQLYNGNSKGDRPSSGASILGRQCVPPAEPEGDSHLTAARTWKFREGSGLGKGQTKPKRSADVPEGLRQPQL